MITRPAVAKWLPPPATPSLQDAQLDVWLLALDTIPCKPDYLDAAETVRLNNFKYGYARQQYCAAHSATRNILGRYLDCQPLDVPLATMSGGKPHIDRQPPPLFFNLSHTRNFALLAVRTQHEVGIDIETVRDMPNTLRIAKRVFTEQQISQLALRQQDGTQQFFELWTHMEARQKCLGRGVFGEAVGAELVETRSIDLSGNLHAAIAWPIGAEPKLINFYSA